MPAEKERCCENCKWSLGTHRLDGWGYCRRFPPTFVPKEIRGGNIRSSVHPEIQLLDDLCGEWTEKPD